VVKAQVLSLDTDKRLMRLSMKQLAPNGLDEYIAEHKAGDIVTGRLMEMNEGMARVELGEGVQGACRIDAAGAARETTAEPPSQGKLDLSSLGSMLQARWKSGATAAETKPGSARAGQVRQFRISKLDPESKKIELEFA